MGWLTRGFGRHDDGRAGRGGHRPARAARHRDRAPARASASRPPGRWRGTGAEVTLAVRDTDAGERTAADIRPPRRAPLLVVSRLDLADGDVDRRVRAPVGGADPRPRPQRRDHGHAGGADAGGLGAPVRDEPPRALPARVGPAPRTWRPTARPRRVRQLARRTCARRWSSTTSTSRSARTTRGRPTAQSKTANVLFAVEATRRWAGRRDHRERASMPGGISDAPAEARRPGDAGGVGPASWRRGRSRRSSRRSRALRRRRSLVTSPALEGIGGRYFEDCEEAVLREDDEPARSGVRRWALDPDAAERLWDDSLAMLAERAALSAAPR